VQHTDDDLKSFQYLKQLLKQARLFALSNREGARMRLDMQIKVQVMSDEIRRISEERDQLAESLRAKVSFRFGSL
jgi:hypothetical protein